MLASVVTEESAAEYLLKTYYELCIQPSMERLAECWGVNEDGRKDAFDALYKSINDPREEFFEYLEKLFEPVLTGEGLAEEFVRSKEYLQIFSKCAAGVGREILEQYCRLSSDGEERAQEKIGNFFKEKMNQFLEERFSDLLEERRKSVKVIANDCGAGAGGGGAGGGIIHRPQARRMADGAESEKGRG